VGSLAFPKMLDDNPAVTHDPLDESDDPERPVFHDDRNENMIADDEETEGAPSPRPPPAGAQGG
ncbi:MAG TPA: hypothetical protein VF710_12815, partial [Longimicrobium sp.]